MVDAATAVGQSPQLDDQVDGVDVPVRNADWAMFVQQLRDAGTMAYLAAKAKDQDKMTDVAGVMTMACGNCHRRYREKKLADRCK